MANKMCPKLIIKWTPLHKGKQTDQGRDIVINKFTQIGIYIYILYFLYLIFIFLSGLISIYLIRKLVIIRLIILELIILKLYLHSILSIMYTHLYKIRYLILIKPALFFGIAVSDQTSFF